MTLETTTETTETTETTIEPTGVIIADTNRDRRGCFSKGNRAAAGPRKSTIRRRKNSEALATACSAKEIRAIVRALIKKALDGDVAAAKEIFDRCLGKPLRIESGQEPDDITIEVMLPERFKDV